jgi:hypothetical protein
MQGWSELGTLFFTRVVSAIDFRRLRSEAHRPGLDPSPRPARPRSATPLTPAGRR